MPTRTKKVLTTAPSWLAVRRRGRHQEVLDVLHDLKAQADHGPVDKTIHEPVELVPGQQEEQDQTRAFVQLLVHGRHDGRPPPLEGVRVHDVLQEGEKVAVGDGGEGETHHTPPQITAMAIMEAGSGSNWSKR